MFDRTFWRAAGGRVLRTILTVLTPWTPAVVSAAALGDWTVLGAALSTTAVAALLALATAIWSLPEIDRPGIPLWKALASRAARQTAHVLISALAAVSLITDIDWRVLALQAVSSVIGTVLLGILARLPEAAPTPAREG